MNPPNNKETTSNEGISMLFVYCSFWAIGLKYFMEQQKNKKKQNKSN